MGTSQTLSHASLAIRRPKGLPIVLLAALALGISSSMDRLVLAHGDSVPYTLFWSISTGEIKIGDYVMLEVDHEIVGSKPARLTKRVVCGPGDHLQRRLHAFYCNEQRLGGFITRTWDDKPLLPFSFDGPIPPGKAFVMGLHPRSFDSRYFGLVDHAELTRLWAVL